MLHSPNMQWTLLFFLFTRIFFNYEDGVNFPFLQVSEGIFLLQALSLDIQEYPLRLSLQRTSGDFFLWLETASQQVDCLEV